MRHHGIVMALFIGLMAFGIWSLPRMNKDEFPQFSIRQGLVVALYPGATADEVEQQVTIPLEDYINSFEAVDKKLTFSISEDGMAYVYVMLRMADIDNEVAWNKIRAGLPLLQKTQMPAGVLQTALIDDFGNTSSILIAVESDQRSPRELEQYTRQICSQLRTIPEMGKLRIMGQQTEEIAITIDLEQLAKDGGVPRSGNVILLGAAQKALGIEYEKLENAIRRVFARKGDAVVDANIKALAIGFQQAK